MKPEEREEISLAIARVAAENHALQAIVALLMARLASAYPDAHDQLAEMVGAIQGHAIGLGDAARLQIKDSEEISMALTQMIDRICSIAETLLPPPEQL